MIRNALLLAAAIVAAALALPACAFLVPAAAPGPASASASKLARASASSSSSSRLVRVWSSSPDTITSPFESGVKVSASGACVCVLGASVLVS
jgi:hypothetical protein